MKRRTAYTPLHQALPYGFAHDKAITAKQKDAALLRHPEKQAMAWLIHQRSAVLEIDVNFKLCEDCHEWFKSCSALVKGRPIKAREPKLTHVFCDGKCSCGDAGYPAVGGGGGSPDGRRGGGGEAKPEGDAGRRSVRAS